MAKIDIAREVFNQFYATSTRKEIIDMMVERGLTEAGASTYYQKLKKESDPDSVEGRASSHIGRLPKAIQVLRETTEWKGYGGEINHIYFLQEGKMIAYIINGEVRNMTGPVHFDKRGRTFVSVDKSSYGMDQDGNIVDRPPTDTRIEPRD